MTLKSTTRIRQLKSILSEKNLTEVVYKSFVEHTPVKSGNARRNTTRSSNEVNAAYGYAKKLDQGRSKQAPDGMVKPAVQALRAYIAKQLGK
jgi:hypothetical protein